jgi:plastocyanin
MIGERWLRSDSVFWRHTAMRHHVRRFVLVPAATILAAALAICALLYPNACISQGRGEGEEKKPAVAPAKTVIVEMKDFAFVPETVEINVGDTVTWINRDTVAHTATRDAIPAFNTGFLNKGESASVTFTAASDSTGFEYYCIPHQSFMKGHVRVSLPGSVSRRSMARHQMPK